MFETVIVAVAGRPQDAEAWALASRLADAEADFIVAKIAVLDRTVLHAAGSDTESPEVVEAEAVVDAFTESRPHAEGVALAAPSIGRGLRELAIGTRADLIVIASSRRGTLGKIFAGDAVRDVLHHAPCPVAVAPVGYQATGPLKRLCVGYDGTREADAAFNHVAHLSRRDGATVSVTEVVEFIVAGSAMSGAYASSPLPEDYERARRNLARLAQRHHIEANVVTGRASRELANLSRGADLLAIGLHDRNWLERLLDGSTAEALLHDQSAPLLLAPPQPVPTPSNGVLAAENDGQADAAA